MAKPVRGIRSSTTEKATSSDSNLTKMNDLVNSLNSKLGEKSVMLLGNKIEKMPSIPSGSLLLDRALGIGGFPKGRLVEIFGGESAGKTALCLLLVASFQRNNPDGVAMFIDSENAFSPSQALTYGVDMDRLLITQPELAEKAMETIEVAVSSGLVKLVILDSIASLVPQAELDGAMGDAHVALLARLLSQSLRRLAGSIKSQDAVVVFTNQLREKVGISYGSRMIA